MPKKTKKEEVTEVFEVKKGKKNKTLIKKGKEEVPIEDKELQKKESKILKYLLITLAGIILFMIAMSFYINSLKHTNYYGVPFEKVFDGVTFYETSILINNNGKIITNYIYIRTPPKILEKIPFNREGYKLMRRGVFNFQDTFDCEYTNIGIANIAMLYSALGGDFFQTTNMTCENNSNYIYFNLMQGNKTEIEKIDDLCYNVKIKDCEILPATEKILAEMIYAYKTK